MTIYYVGTGGNDGNAGTSWALRKLTLNGAEDIPVVAGDTVYVGPGTYREILMVDVDGGAGNVITYIGDYDGSHTDGVGGVVRITGSDDDQGATRTSCITAVSKNYRTFRGFLCDMTTGGGIVLKECTNVIVDNCAVMYTASAPIQVLGAAQASVTIRNCYVDYTGNQTKGIFFYHIANVDNTAHVVENCIIRGHGHNNASGIQVYKIGGVTVRNCDVANVRMGISIASALTAGQTLTVNNCIVESCDLALYATAADGSFVEDYNSIYNAATARTNVGAGANSLAYPALRDARWFFELVGGGSMLSPFDLASYSQLLNVAGTSPTASDMRGTTVQGAEREWGPLEYDGTLDIKGGTGGGGGPVIGSRIIRGLGAI